MYMYKREAILDSRNRSVQAAMGFVFEKIPRDMDAIVFSINRRIRFLKLEKGFSHEDGLIKLKFAIGWIGKYEKGDVQHSVKAVYAKDSENGEIGLQVIMDVTTELLPLIEGELDHTLKSLHFVPEESKK